MASRSLEDEDGDEDEDEDDADETRGDARQPPRCQLQQRGVTGPRDVRPFVRRERGSRPVMFTQQPRAAKAQGQWTTTATWLSPDHEASKSPRREEKTGPTPARGVPTFVYVMTALLTV
ncbi:MAG: hypothetical protein M1819_003201 [Sarea resinae]|nr:MAG: hypothetical protein M1819_003201 [Sarea resinae]